MAKIIIYGIGEFAELLYYYLINDSKYDVVSFCADREFIHKTKISGLPIVSFEEVDIIYPAKEYKMIIAIGYSNMRNRELVYNKAKLKEYSLINYFHSSVDIRNMSFGENNIILPNCTVEPFVKIGNNNIIWSMTLLGHHSTIGNHNYISAQCLIAGKVKVENLCFIGNGVTMINGITIEDETYLIAGTNQRKTTKKYGMYIGNPSKLLKYNKENGIVIK